MVQWCYCSIFVTITESSLVVSNMEERTSCTYNSSSYSPFRLPLFTYLCENESCVELSQQKTFWCDLWISVAFLHQIPVIDWLHIYLKVFIDLHTKLFWPSIYMYIYIYIFLCVQVTVIHTHWYHKLTLTADGVAPFEVSISTGVELT